MEKAEKAEKEEKEEVLLDNDGEESSDETPDGYCRPAARQTVEPGLRLSQLGLLRLGLKPKNAPRDEIF